MTEECPTPTKVRFLSRKEAKDYRKHGAKKARSLPRTVRPYMCACGFWHLGKLPKKAILKGRTYAFKGYKRGRS